MSGWVQVLRAEELAPGQSRLVTAEGRELVVFNVAGQFHVLPNDCPHVGGPLAEGEFAGQVVTCPWHKYQFDVTTGKGLNNKKETTCLTAKVEGAWVCVELGTA